jgi:kynureninase
VELTAYWDRFPILESTTYLINHSLGAMLAEAERRLQRFAHGWATRGARAWGEGWWESAFSAGDLVGSIIGAPPGTTVMHQNVTVAEAIVLSCFDLKPPRNRIVFEEGLFPSVRYVQQAWSRFGAEVVVCEDAEAVIDAIDERTLLGPVSHVLYRSGEIQPVERVVARAREAGALVCLDAYQSVGAVPLDVTALGVEFCVGGSRELDAADGAPRRAARRGRLRARLAARAGTPRRLGRLPRAGVRSGAGGAVTP